MGSNIRDSKAVDLNQIKDPVQRLKKLTELSMMIAGNPVNVFRHVARLIGEIFDVRVVCLSEIRGDELYFVSVYVDGEVMMDAGHCPLDITPCATVESTKDVRIYDKVIEKFPKAGFLREHDAFSYCGFPALGSDGEVVAVTCLLDDKPHEFSDEDQNLLRSFGQRISMEIERQKLMKGHRRDKAALFESESMLQNVLDTIPARVFWKDLQLNYLGCNQNFANDAGLNSPEEIIGKNDYELGWSDQAELYRADDRQVIETGAPKLDFEELQTTSDGKEIWLQTSKIPLKNLNGDICGVLGSHENITARKQAEEKLQDREKHYRQLVESARAIPWELDLKTWRFTYVGPQAVEILGYPVEAWYQEDFWIDKLYPDDRDWAFDFCKTATARGENHQFEYRMLAADGRPVWIRDDVTVISNEQGPVAMHGYMFDITDRKQAEEQVQHLAYYDSLTQLPNRSLFMDRLQQSLSLSTRHNYSGAILYLDLDRFKNINDSLGHSVGDALLQELAVRLDKCVRNEDTVARLGGDEFVVLLTDIGTDQKQVAKEAHLVADKILASLSEPYFVENHELQIAPSIGIALFPEENNTVEDVIKHADTAMYRAKAAGRDAIQFFQPNMQIAALERLAMEKGLRHALEQNEMLLHYQPLVEISDNQVIGAEVLLRWQPPDQDMIAPSRFIPVAEDTGQILSIGQWVLRNALTQVKAWKESGFNLYEKFLTVNVSPRQFRQADFVQQVMRILEETEFPPTSLKFEITEGVVMADIEDTIEKMHALKSHGITFAVDDFGTGHSSLAYLKRLPLDVLKIDKSFIADIANDPDDSVIVDTIIAMAKHLGLAVIAEGVETEAELKFLQEHGCGCYQGYHFSKPLPADEFVRFLE